MDNALSVNREWWNERAELHGQDSHYDTAGFLAGSTSLTRRAIDEVSAAAGSLEGLDLLHLQCHFGLDTLSWSRMGARATGVDFSSRAIEKARDLAQRVGLQAQFVEADVQHLPSHLNGRFDLVFASDGVFCWIADLDLWMKSAFEALRPGGHLVALDGHPLLHMISSLDPLSFDAPYKGGVPVKLEGPGSYANPIPPTRSNVMIEYSHGVGEIVTAAVGAGFWVDAFTEWLDKPSEGGNQIMGRPDDRLTQADDGSWRLRLANGDLPCYFSLRATKPS